jgi:hypothetical protein
MGHHPGDIAQTQSYNQQGLAPITWMLIIAGLIILVFVVYYLIKSRKK